MKYFNKIILILFLITLNLIFCMKSKDFCGLNQKEDECQGLFNYKCGSDMCAKNITDCTELLKMNSYLILLLKNKIIHTKQIDKFKLESEKIQTFYKNIKKCDIKFKSNDICLNGANCVEKRLSNTKKFGYKYVIYEVGCKCPTNHNYICGQYCFTDLETCNYYKSIEKISKNFKKIKKCGNHKTSEIIKPSFFSWNG